MNQNPEIQTIEDSSTSPKKKGCGCLSLIIGGSILILALILSIYLVLKHTAIPMRIAASAMAGAEPDAVLMTGISGSSASGYHIARIESGKNVFEDVRLHTTGMLRMIREKEFIVYDAYVGKARITADFLASDTESQSESGDTSSSTRNEDNFYIQIDRLSLNDMVITDSLTGAEISIPKFEWTDFKAGKGKFDIGNIHLESNKLSVQTSKPAPDQQRIEAAIFPDIHERLLKPITIVAEFHHENNQITGEFQAFDGALSLSDDADGNGKLVVKDLHLADFIDGPLPRDIQINVVMLRSESEGEPRKNHLSGSFQLGNVPFIINPVVLTESTGAAAMVATGKHGDTKFRYAFTNTKEGDEANLKPLLTSEPPMNAEAMLARIFFDAKLNDLDPDTRQTLTEMAEWFRFSDN